jgi:pimeloyl-ACP methyl ester carboxylesterase
MSTTEREVLSIRLRDGRVLAYAEYGDPDGAVVLLFHGTPGSRLDATLLPKNLAVRLIALDRPGCGRSDPQAERTLLGWAADVQEFADVLGLDRFAVAGVSGGGPHALACGVAASDRLTRIGVICGLGPMDRSGVEEGMNPFNVVLVRAARDNPEQVEAMIGVMATVATADPLAAADQMAAALPETDRAVLARPEIREVLPEVLLEGFHQGPAAAAQEFLMLSRPWGFRLEDITCDVSFWQGDADANVPVAHVRYMADVIPNSSLEIVPGKGHYSLLDDAPRFLAALTEEG